METMKRREAKKLGLLLYFTGKVCINGHLSERYTVSGHCLVCDSEARKMEKNKAKRRELMSKWRKSEPKEKTRARNVVNNALISKKLSRLPCERCGTENNVQAHHEDYSKPLDVSWLCSKHHYERHREIRNNG